MKRLIVLFLFWPMLSYTQDLRLFADTLQKLRPGTPSANLLYQGIYTYIPNISTDGTRTISTLMKVDTSGKTIWTAYPTNFVTAGAIPTNIGFQKIIAASDSNIYSLFSGTTLGKIRADNGSVEWMVPLYPVLSLRSMHLLDYDTETLIFANSDPSINKIRVVRYHKSKGQNLGFKELHCPGPNIAGVFTQGGAIYVANADSLFKYKSFDDPVLEWKVKITTGTDRFLQVHNMIMEGNLMIIFGNKEDGFHNGMVACIDLLSKSLKWFVKNGQSFDYYYAAHRIKNGALYTTWQHMYVGSILAQKCFIHKIDINTGTKIWEFNHVFRTQPVFVSVEEAMVSMDIDDNETLYLSGYGLPDNETQKRWGFMKIRGKDGVVLKRTFMPQSDTWQSFPVGITIRFVDGKLYSTGLMPGYIAGTHLDTSNLSFIKTVPFQSTIQYTSSVIGIRNFSINKKAVLLKQGKSLKLQLVDAYLNKIWERTIGDTIPAHEGIDVLGVNEVTKTIFITGRRYESTPSNNFYIPPSSNHTFLFQGYDSVGNLIHNFSGSDVPVQNPFQFFQDSLGRSWFARVTGTDVFAQNYPNPTYTIRGKWTPRPYTLIKPNTYFAYSKDTILLFKEPTGSIRASVLKTWQGYLPVANAKYWYLSGIRWFNSVAREDKDNYYAMAKDSSLKDMIFKFQVKDSSVAWTKKFDSTIITIKGDALNGSLYALSTKGDTVLIRKFNGATGDLVWTKFIESLPGHIVKAGDFAVSKQRFKLIFVGYQVDTIIRDMSKIHITVLDTSGNEIQSLTRDGYRAWQNKATTIEIGQDGQTLIGGQVADSVLGYAGFIGTIDSTSLKLTFPMPIASNIITPVCSSSSIQTAKLVNPVNPAYNISITQDNMVVNYNFADSTFQYSISAVGNHNLRISYSYRDAESFTNIPFVVKSSPTSGSAPFAIGSLLTAPATGNTYQWYLNGSSIAGAVTNTIVATQGGNYSYTYSVDGCSSLPSASLNFVITAILDPTNNNARIIISPNPTKGHLIISNLNATDQYGIKLFDMNGAEIKTLTLLGRGNIAELRLENINRGNYILQLWNLSKKKLIGEQVILLIK